MKDDQNKQNPTKSATQKVAVGRRKKKSKKGWIVLILLIAVLGAIGWTATKMVKPSDSVADEGGTFTVRKGDLMVTVTEGGSIRAHKSIQYKCQVERRGAELTIVSVVPAGTYVTQKDVNDGMVLVELDSSALEDQLVQEEMELSSDRENATAQKEAYDIQTIQNESDIANGKLKVRFALMDLQKYIGDDMAAQLVKDMNEASSVPEQVAPLLAKIRNDPNVLEGSQSGSLLKTNRDNIVKASGTLSKAQAQLAGTEKLHDANYVSDLDLKSDQLSVVNSRFQEENAAVDLALFLDYDFPMNVEQLLSDYIEAGRDLERTYAECRSKLAQAQARLSNAQQRYQQQNERVDDLKKQIDYCTIRAKAPGLVIYGTGDSGDTFRAMRGRGGGSGIIAEGEAVYQGQVIISMPDTAEMIAEISVHETEVDKVRAGQPAEIVMDAFPDRILQGEVLEVAPLPDQQRGFLNPDLKVYKTLVAINGTHDFLKTRMSCKVQILVRQLKDALQVPIQVVANRHGQKVCYVVTPDGPKETEVTTGAFNDTFVQITKGLKEGDVVLLNPPLFTESDGSSLEGPDRERFGGRSALKEDKGTKAGAAGAGSPEGESANRGSEDSSRRSGRRGGQRGGPSGDDGTQMRGGPSGDNTQGQGRSMEITDEMIDRSIAMLKQFNPAKAKEYEELRQKDPEALKKKMREDMAQMRQRMRQGGGGFPGGGRGRGGGGRPGQVGASGAGPGPGGNGAAGSGQQSEGQNDR